MMRRQTVISQTSDRMRREGSALVLLVALFLTACGGSSATDTPSRGVTPAASATVPSVATSAATAPAAATPAATSVASATGGASVPATALPSAATSAPPFGTPLTTKRGEGGQLRLLWWLAPSILNVHLASGTKDQDAASIVSEPLAWVSATSLVPDIPILAKEIPSTRNGQISADYTTVTWKLKDGVTWSDGMPFTAADVVFTWQWVTKPENGSVSTAAYSGVSNVEAVDPATVKITFKAPTAAWFLPFVGGAGEILPKHIVSTCTNAKDCPFNMKPIGTGPYVVTDFKPGDIVNYTANEKFREPNAPYFATIEMKGGGDPATAAKAVQTGQVDYAWNLQAPPTVRKQLQDAGKTVAAPSGGYVEQMRLNQADPRIEIDGELSSPKSKNPFLTDPLVRRALALAVDREAIAKNLYGIAGVAGNTVIPTQRGDSGKPWAFDLKKAGDLLDQAGWKMGSDGVREKNGVKMNLTFRTSINPVRDNESQVIKGSFKQLGINLDLRPADGSVFFGGTGNPDQSTRFTVDIEMYGTSPSVPDAQSFLEAFTTGQIAQKSNNWGGTNDMRWSDPAYDALYAQLKTELDPGKRKVLFKQLDDTVVDAGVAIPLVLRAAVSGYRPDLQNVQFSPFASELWNIGHWYLKK